MIRTSVKCGFAASLLVATVAAPAIAAPAAAESRVESSNMKLAGYSDLRGVAWLIKRGKVTHTEEV